MPVKYTQNGVSQTDCDVFLETKFANLSLHAALTQKSKFSDGRLDFRCIYHSHTLYTLGGMLEGKKRKKNIDI